MICVLVFFLFFLFFCFVFLETKHLDRLTTIDSRDSIRRYHSHPRSSTEYNISLAHLLLTKYGRKVAVATYLGILGSWPGRLTAVVGLSASRSAAFDRSQLTPPLIGGPRQPPGLSAPRVPEWLGSVHVW